jgi:AraC-like DNA-binding protein
MADIDSNMSEIDSCVGGISIIDYCCQNIAPFWKSADLCGPWWRLYRDYESGGIVSIDGRATNLRSDRIYLIPPMCRLAVRCRGNPLQFFIHFTASASFEQPTPGVYSFSLEPNIDRLIGRCFSNRPGGEETVERTLVCFELVARILERLYVEYKDSFERTERVDPRITASMGLLLSDTDHKMRLSEIAARAGMSPDGFIRLFRKTTGMTPITFRKRLRLYAAAQQLASTKATIDQIAENVGYQDRFGFSKAFCEQYGKPPAEFRSRAKDG